MLLSRHKWQVVMKMLENLQLTTTLLMLLGERVSTVIPFYGSFARIGCIRDVVAVKVNWKRIAPLNVRHVQISRQGTG